MYYPYKQQTKRIYIPASANLCLAFTLVATLLISTLVAPCPVNAAAIKPAKVDSPYDAAQPWATPGGNLGEAIWSARVAVLGKGAEGLIPFSVSIENTLRYGFMNIDMQVQIPAVFSNAKDFSEGYAVVQNPLNGKWAFIDKTCTRLASLEFNKAESFTDGLALVHNGTGYGLINTKGQWVIPPHYFDLQLYPKDSVEYTYLTPPQREFVAFPLKGKGYGIINIHEKWIVEPNFTSINLFSDGLAAFSITAKNPLWNAIEESHWGKMSTVFLRDSRKDLHIQEFIPLYGYLNRKGEVVINPIFKLAGPFYNGKAQVVTADSAMSRSRWAIIDNAGKILEKFDSVPNPYSWGTTKSRKSSQDEHK